jgi:hypothetical protein
MSNLDAIEPKSRELVLRQFMSECPDAYQSNPDWYFPNNWYRWLVRLDCGCITETLTLGSEVPPTELRRDNTILGKEEPIRNQTWIMVRSGSFWCHFYDKRNPFPGGCCLPLGYLHCSDHDYKAPWREITQWLGRDRVLYLERGKTVQSWWVKLSCGHCDTVTADDMKWSPGMPPRLETEREERVVARLSAKEEESPDEDRRDIIEWMTANIENNGWMVCDPPMSAECFSCALQRRIVEYRLIGKLADDRIPKRKPKPEPPTPEEIKAKKQRRLKRVESEIRRLQREAETLRDDEG